MPGEGISMREKNDFSGCWARRLSNGRSQGQPSEMNRFWRTATRRSEGGAGEDVPEIAGGSVIPAAGCESAVSWRVIEVCARWRSRWGALS